MCIAFNTVESKEVVDVVIGGKGGGVVGAVKVVLVMAWYLEGVVVSDRNPCVESVVLTDEEFGLIFRFIVVMEG